MKNFEIKTTGSQDLKRIDIDPDAKTVSYVFYITPTILFKENQTESEKDETVRNTIFAISQRAERIFGKSLSSTLRTNGNQLEYHFTAKTPNDIKETFLVLVNNQSYEPLVRDCKADIEKIVISTQSNKKKPTLLLQEELAKFKYADPKYIKELINQGADINTAASVTGTTAAHVAAVLQDRSLIEFLKQHQADFNQFDANKYPPVGYAGEENISALYEAGADLLMEFGSSKKTMLARLQVAGSTIDYSKLLAFELDKFRPDSKKEGNKFLVNALIEAGANVNIKAPSTGHTAAHIAAKESYGDLLINLHSRHADLNSLDKSGFSPADFSENTQIKELFILYGGLPTISEQLCSTPLTILNQALINAVKKYQDEPGPQGKADNASIIKALIKAGASAKTTLESGTTVACIAVRDKDVALLELLRTQGISFHASSSKELYSPLALAKFHPEPTRSSLLQAMGMNQITKKKSHQEEVKKTSPEPEKKAAVQTEAQEIPTILPQTKINKSASGNPDKSQIAQQVKRLNRAKVLWTETNNKLNSDSVDLKAFFKDIHELHTYMRIHGIKQSDLRILLQNETISLKGWTILQQIYTSLGFYSREAATEEESIIEAGFASAINNQQAFFMDCKLAPNERAEGQDPKFKLAIPQIIIAAMQHIKEVASPHAKLMGNPIREVMDTKIKALERLEPLNPGEDPTLFYQILNKIYADKGPSRLSQVQSHYRYGTLTGGRGYHFFKASTENFASLKEKYPHLSGDELKTAILINFRKELEKATNRPDLERIITHLEQSEEYKALQQSQGFLTWLLNWETSSVTAFKQMKEEFRQQPFESDIGYRQKAGQ